MERKGSGQIGPHAQNLALMVPRQELEFVILNPSMVVFAYWAMK